VRFVATGFLAVFLAACMSHDMPVSRIAVLPAEWNILGGGKTNDWKVGLEFRNERDVYKAAYGKRSFDDTPGRKIFPYVSVFKLDVDSGKNAGLDLSFTNAVFECESWTGVAYSESNFFQKYPGKEYDSEKLSVFFSWESNGQKVRTGSALRFSADKKFSGFLVFEAFPKDIKSAFINLRFLPPTGSNETVKPIAAKPAEIKLRLPLSHERVREKKGV